MRTPELLSDPAFHDEEAARVYLEGVRWPDGPYCPFCGSLETVKPLGGPSMGPGWYYCSACQDKFTVRVGSIFERSHIPIHKWLLAFRLMASSKKGVSAHQIHRTLGITYKSAWFLMHRIREAMTNTDPTPLGGEGKTVEADETFYGYREGGPKWILHPQFGWQRDRGSAQRMTIVTLVERGGAARSIPAEDLKASTLRAIVLGNADTKSKLMTDERHTYETIGRRFAGHGTRQPRRRGICSRRSPCEQRRRLLLNFQARDDGRLSALQRGPFAPLPRRVRFPLFEPHQARG